MQAEIYALVALIAGFVIARTASAAAGAFLAALGRRAARLTTSEESLLTPRLIRVVRQSVFWVLLAAAFVLALSFLGVAVDRVLTLTMDFVPSILIAIAIVVAGHLAGVLAGKLVTGMVENLPGDSVVPRLLYAAIVAIAGLMALQQLGVDISFVAQLLLIVVAIAGGGFMLAFALGAKQHVSNLLAHRELERFHVGDTVSVGEVTGTITAIHSTSVEIATTEGTTLVPASRFAADIVTRRSGGDGG